MMFNRRTFLFTALGCGLISIPATALLAQQNPAPPATSQEQAQPAAGQNQDQEPIRLIAK